MTCRWVTTDGAKAPARCQPKKKAHQLDHVTLIQANAMFPPLAEQAFDHIMIAHTISVVHEPNKLLLWAQKLVKPGGTIVLLNHFHAHNRVVAFFETLPVGLPIAVVDELCRDAGWPLTTWAAAGR